MINSEGIRLLLCGGETGGHLYPALAIADALIETLPGSEAIYIGATGRVDMEQTIGTKYISHALDICGYERGYLKGNIALPWKILKSIAQASRLLRQYRPHVVMGVGAFPSVPVLLAARLHNIPCLILEPNALPGLANKILARIAQRICVSCSDMDTFFPREKIVFTGTPVRNPLLQQTTNRQRARAEFGISEATQTLLITGGSAGSKTINRLILDNLNLLVSKIGYLLWQTGEHDFLHIREVLGDRIPENCTIIPYINNMGSAYAAADLVVSSAGAASLAELALLGKPALIIPDPDVTENHQMKNGQFFSAKGAFVKADTQSLSTQTITDIIDLLNNQVKLKKLGENIQQFAQPQAAQLIIEQVLQLAGRCR